MRYCNIISCVYIAGMKLKKQIARMGLNQKQFAALADLDQTRLSRILSGQIQPNIDEAMKIELASDRSVSLESWPNHLKVVEFVKARV